MNESPAPSARSAAERNRLRDAKSPYLLQHAEDPVHWQPWDDLAFQAARELDKPVLISIGYTSCHWCHVMQRESFHDPEAAALLNEAFVCIKVDREERPDLDSLYMSVCQILIGSGGWPLNVVATPDGNAFFAATYLPRQGAGAQPGLLDLVPRLQEVWEERREEVESATAQIQRALAAAPPPDEQAALAPDLAHRALAQLREQFDEEAGGFGAAPKFPLPHALTFLFRHAHRHTSEEARRLTLHTLSAIDAGGIHDHIGGGIHRYATDRHWRLPHFEKMLYDQALLAAAALAGLELGFDAACDRLARDTLDYVLRDASTPEGGFITAEGAESEGREGAFYTWTVAEIREHLPPETAEAFITAYDLRPEGNVRELGPGLNLPRRRPLAEAAGELSLDEETLARRLAEAREALRRVREDRPRPARDDKVLADWNGLMIAALAQGGRLLGEERYLQGARRAADFILAAMRSTDGDLRHRWFRGEAGIPAFLDDYAFFLWGLVELYRATLEPSYLVTADEFADRMLTLFGNGDGALHATRAQDETAGIRRQYFYDGAIPSGNAVAALALTRLAHLTGRPRWRDAATELATAIAGHIHGRESAHTQFLVAVDLLLAPTRRVVVAGAPSARGTQDLVRAAREAGGPELEVLLHDAASRPGALAEAVPGIEAQTAADGHAVAYPCGEQACREPVADPAALREAVRAL